MPLTVTFHDYDGSDPDQNTVALFFDADGPFDEQHVLGGFAGCVENLNRGFRVR